MASPSWLASPGVVINHLGIIARYESGDNRMVKKAREEAYFYIRRKIVSGELVPGQAVSEVLHARKLGISRTPIREAIGQLAAEGILEQSPHRCAVVVKLSRQDITELYELREALEIYAVGKAARQPLRQGDLNGLQSLNDAILNLRDELQQSGKSVLNPDQMHRFVTYDLAFHTLLLRLAVNARLLKIAKDTWLLVRIFAIRHRGYTIVELDDIHRGHCEVVRGIAEHNSPSAMQAISEHIQLSQVDRLDDFNQREIDASVQQSILGGTRPQPLPESIH